MSVIDQLGAKRHKEPPFDKIRCDAIRGDERVKYGFDLVRYVNKAAKQLRRGGCDANLAFVDDEGDTLKTDIPFAALQGVLSNEYPLILNVRQDFLDFIVGFRLDFPVVYFDAAQAGDLGELSAEVQQEFIGTLEENIPDECLWGEDVGDDAYSFLAAAMLNNEDFGNVFFENKYLEFPDWRKAVSYVKSPLFRDEISVRDDWKKLRLSYMEQNLAKIVHFLKDTEIFDDVVEECEEELSAKLEREVDSGNVHAFYNHYADQVHLVLDILYDTDSSYSLYSESDFNQYIVSERIAEEIRNDFAQYEKVLRQQRP